MAAITICSDFGDPQKIKSDTVSTVSPSMCHEVMGPAAMILVFWMSRKHNGCELLELILYSLFKSIITRFFSLYFLFPFWSTAPYSSLLFFSLLSSYSSSLFYFCYGFLKGLSCSWDSKESTCKAGDPGSIPSSGRSPDLHAFLRRAWQPTPVILPGESHGQKSLVGYSPQGRKVLDTTERLHLLSLSFLNLDIQF